jgi:biopolymer transport protein ExbD
LQIKLPTANADQAAEQPDRIVIEVSADGRYALGNGTPRSIAPDALAAALSQASASHREPMLVIQADASARHQSVIEVLGAARQAGISRVTFAAQGRAPGAAAGTGTGAGAGPSTGEGESAATGTGAP